jgi:protein PhnA
MLENLDQYLVSQNALAGVGITKDSQGQVLSEGDSVKVIKDLKVKGSSMVVKRGTLIKKIHLISGNDEEVDCKVEGVALALETQWLVKA